MRMMSNKQHKTAAMTMTAIAHTGRPPVELTLPPPPFAFNAIGGFFAVLLIIKKRI